MTATDSVATSDGRGPNHLSSTTTLPSPAKDVSVPPALKAAADRQATKPPRVDRRDPRYLALRNFAISMSIFNILGYTVLGFEQPWAWPFFALAIGLGLEIVIALIAAWATRSTPAFAGHGAWGSSPSSYRPTSPRSRSTCCSTRTTGSGRSPSRW